jgi:hypothetical protein
VHTANTKDGNILKVMQSVEAGTRAQNIVGNLKRVIKKTMLIKVTEDDIKHGERGICNTCPVARAIRRATGAKYIAVDWCAIDIGDKLYDTPRSAARFIYDFDNGLKVEPFEFELGETL